MKRRYVRRGKMRKKPVFLAAICLIIFIMSGNSFAADSNKPKLFKGEVSFLIGPVLAGSNDIEFAGILIGGIFVGKNLGLEANAYRNFQGYGYINYSGNLVLNLPVSEQISLFLTAGIGYGSDSNANFGGGAKGKISDKWLIRVEYRSWGSINLGYEGSSILSGVGLVF
jgi:hypothetical protein